MIRMSSVLSMPSTRRSATRRTGMRAISTSLLRGGPLVALRLLGVVVLGRGLHARRDFAQEVVVGRSACDRRGGARAEAAVLHDHRQRDARAVDRREGDEPRVVAQALGDLGLLVLLVLLDAH